MYEAKDKSIHIPICKDKQVKSQSHKKKKRGKKRKRPRCPYKPQSLATEFIKINRQAEDIYSRTMFSKCQCHKISEGNRGKKT